MRNVFTAQSPAEAHLVAGLLEEEGIECVVEGEFLTGVRMVVPMDSATLPAVFVNDGDAARVLALIAERSHARDASDGTSEGAHGEEVMAERTGLVWFKRMLLAWIVLGVAGALQASIGFTAWIAGTQLMTSLGAQVVATGAEIGVACAIAWLVVPLRRAPR
jgi:hypothetical protein